MILLKTNKGRILQVEKYEDVTDFFGDTNEPYEMVLRTNNDPSYNPNNESIDIYNECIHIQDPSLVIPGCIISKDKTKEEFLDYIVHISKYWSKVEHETNLGQIQGAIFSTLSCIDGEGGDFGGFRLIPNDENNDDNLSNDSSIYEPVDICDGELHSQFLRKCKEREGK